MNIFSGREDERNCHCNNCESMFLEGELVIKDDEEYCPVCFQWGFIADDCEEIL
jgi:formylmethanofuran dehydrogenase subunit E